ncbi:Fc receptor-like protein 6 [Ammospiza nelsoni]|uniref:Fc receptor-like protein 6 n=1 Tax=Ammospiza nelsoni TaxID=2857394 RepID=UPI00286AA399|nr:Fc receptor-like protein 6 [Ammospiza nelsoni]
MGTGPWGLPPPTSPVPSPFQPRPSASLLLVEPPWRPAVLWDGVTLTCQGSGTAGATIWYKDGQRWWQERRDHFTVTEIGTYTCERPGTGLSSPLSQSGNYSCRGWVGFWGLQESPQVTVTVQARLELRVSARELLEGDTVTLHCQRWRDYPVTKVRFFHGDKEVEASRSGTKLLLSPLQLHHSGNYSCRGLVDSKMSLWAQSAPVTVTVHELFSVPVLEGPLEPIDGQVVGGPQGSPQLLVPAMGGSHSGNYSCQVRSEGGAVQKSSAWIHITVHMPVANATITPGHLSHQIHAGDNVTLQCLVQVGSAPVTFTWLHNGQQVAWGPLLELRDIDVGHSGTYQCVATNQLGQDGHRVFQAFSPELALEVTTGSPWVTVAAGVGGALLFLLPLVAVIVTWHRRHRVAARKNQERAPPDPLAPPEEGEVLYTHVVVTKRAGASPHATTLQDPQVTYVELRGPQGRLQEPGDIYGNVL